MTSTSFSIGLGEGARASSKVLKPPGGGSSDIFGSTEPDQSQSPRRVKTHMASNINLSDTTDSSSASSTASSDSPTPTSPGPRKDKDDANDIELTPSSAAELQSESGGANLADESAPADSAPAGEEESAPVDESAPAEPQLSAEPEQPEPVEVAPVARKNHMQSNIVLGDDRPVSVPVDRKESGGESLQNGGAPKSNGAPVAPRTRVPPGGYSSGLW